MAFLAKWIASMQGLLARFGQNVKDGKWINQLQCYTKTPFERRCTVNRLVETEKQANGVFSRENEQRKPRARSNFIKQTPKTINYFNYILCRLLFNWLNCVNENGHSVFQPHGLAEDTSMVRPRPSTHPAWYGVKHHSVMLLVWYLAAYSLRIQCVVKATSQCWIHCRIRSVNAWVVCCFYQLYAVKCFGQLASWPLWVSLIVSKETHTKISFKSRLKPQNKFEWMTLTKFPRIVSRLTSIC